MTLRSKQSENRNRIKKFERIKNMEENKREILLKQLAEKSNKQNLARKQIIMGVMIWFCSTVTYWIYAFVSWVVKLNLERTWAKNFDWFLENIVREQLWFWLILYVVSLITALTIAVRGLIKFLNFYNQCKNIEREIANL